MVYRRDQNALNVRKCRTLSGISLIWCIEETIFYYFYNMTRGYMYIVLCNDDTFYTGSTKDLELRVSQHQAGEGANYTKNRLPVSLIYYEEYDRIDQAFYREKQIQGWSQKKKIALINRESHLLPELARKVFSDIK